MASLDERSRIDDALSADVGAEGIDLTERVMGRISDSVRSNPIPFPVKRVITLALVLVLAVVVVLFAWVGEADVTSSSPSFIGPLIIGGVAVALAIGQLMSTRSS